MADILAIILVMLILYKPVLWIARLVVKRGEELGADIEKGINQKGEKSAKKQKR